MDKVPCWAITYPTSSQSPYNNLCTEKVVGLQVLPQMCRRPRLEPMVKKVEAATLMVKILQ